MIKLLALSLSFNLLTIVVLAQNSTVRGTVKDDIDKKPVAGATVAIFLRKDSTHAQRGSTVTDAKGSFELANIGNDSFFIEISSVGYEKIKRPVVTDGGVKDLGIINFTKKGTELQDVTVVSQAPPVVQKGDTAQFSANQFKVNPDATTEDLIKKMPGITVAKDGT